MKVKNKSQVQLSFNVFPWNMESPWSSHQHPVRSCSPLYYSKECCVWTDRAVPVCVREVRGSRHRLNIQGNNSFGAAGKRKWYAILCSLLTTQWFLWILHPGYISLTQLSAHGSAVMRKLDLVSGSTTFPLKMTNCGLDTTFVSIGCIKFFKKGVSLTTWI